jgi:hypothetical protein
MACLVCWDVMNWFQNKRDAETQNNEEVCDYYDRAYNQRYGIFSALIRQ